MKTLLRILGEDDDPFWLEYSDRQRHKMQRYNDLVDDIIKLTIAAKKNSSQNPDMVYSGQKELANLRCVATESPMLAKPLITFRNYYVNNAKLGTQTLCIELLGLLNQLNARAIHRLLKSIPELPLGELVFHMNTRVPEIEQHIVANKVARREYLGKFPDAEDDWILNGWLDWLDT